MTHRHLYLACYDVADAGRLAAALRLARAYATGGQKSVHELYLTAGEHAQLVDGMRRLIDPQTDRFMLLRLDPRHRVHALGIAQAPADPAYFYVG